MAAGQVLTEDVPMAIGAVLSQYLGNNAGSEYEQFYRGQLNANYPDLWMTMIETADIVAGVIMLARRRTNMHCKVSSVWLLLSC